LKYYSAFLSSPFSPIAGTLEQLVTSGLLPNGIPDVLRLDPARLSSLPGWQSKRAMRVTEGIRRSLSTASQERILFALGIQHVGKVVSEALVAKFGSIEAIAEATEEEIMQTRGIGIFLFRH
jgi:DNA ligase (NAD+)